MHGNAEALERTIAALEGLTQEHDAIVEHARTLALLLDTGGGALESKLHGEYRQVLAKLLEVGRKQDVDALANLLDWVRGGGQTGTD